MKSLQHERKVLPAALQTRLDAALGRCRKIRDEAVKAATVAVAASLGKSEVAYCQARARCKVGARLVAVWDCSLTLDFTESLS